ncbi:hypothetical protein [Streptomyces sp. NBC_01304]|uniref:hypothetical protein n=1 Tax=Streptomyces sp. NBC_01304 TaxID=2903818 RepID=UPI002E13BBCE|nr:hypothetical protein OG430_11185 [Streptomyces sp. NBC_01304]
MIRRPRARDLLALSLLPALLLTGCGIRGTDVIESGRPATGELQPDRERSTVLYFVAPDRKVLPVHRYTGGRMSFTGALDMLLGGPDERERGARLSTELPVKYGSVTLSGRSDALQVNLGIPVMGLSAVARRQLVCTTAEAARVVPGQKTAGSADPAPTTAADEGDVQVIVKGTDGQIGPARCTL